MIDAEAKQRALIAAYQKCFTTDEGLAVLAHLSKFCMELRSTYTPGDPYQTAFNEGARTVILEIRRRVEKSLEAQPPTQAVSE